MKDLIADFAQPGTVTWIGLRPERRASVVPVARALAGPRGLDGDHGSSARRAVTLLQAEHLPVIGAMLGRDAVDPADLRRNLLVAGLNLSALRGRRLNIGKAQIHITGICAPCSRMEEIFGTGGYSAVRGHGGWCAEVLVPGTIKLGDPVTPL